MYFYAEEMYFKGQVMSFDVNKGKHVVRFDNAGEEIEFSLDQNRTKWLSKVGSGKRLKVLGRYPTGMNTLLRNEEAKNLLLSFDDGPVEEVEGAEEEEKLLPPPEETNGATAEATESEDKEEEEASA